MSWKSRYYRLINSRPEAIEFEPVLGEGDVALLGEPHSRGTSAVAIRSSGALEAFGSPYSGMRIDPGLGAITLQAPRISLLADQIDFYTSPRRLRWNNIPLHLSPTLRGFTATGEPVVVAPGTLDPVSGAAQKIVEGLGKASLLWLSQAF